MNEKKSLTTQDIQQFVLGQFLNLKQTKPSINKLVYFHTINKFLLMSFDQNELVNLGRIVANKQNSSLSQVIADYEKTMKRILQKTPTRSRHANVLRKIFGHFYKKIPKSRAALLEQQIIQYQKGKITLSDILNQFESLTFDYDTTYVSKQTYYLLYSDKKQNYL